jgi:endo-alpha-1,4-polygalactosaminidase (GH114 family)
MLKNKRFDGLFLDNTDMVETHPRRKPGMRRLVKSLAKTTHAKHRLLFAQNGDETVKPLLRYLDGWNREDVSFTYDFDARRYEAQPPSATTRAQKALERIAAAGLLVTATDYVAAGDDSATDTARENACAAGALPFVSDINLTRLPPDPLACPTATR